MALILVTAMDCSQQQAYAQSNDLQWLLRPVRGATYTRQPSTLIREDKSVIQIKERTVIRRKKSKKKDIISKLKDGLPEQASRSLQFHPAQRAGKKRVDRFGRVVSLVQDSRMKVPEKKLTILPFSAIVRLQILYSKTNTLSMGTGFLVDPGVVITAGHILFSEKYGLAEQIAVTPGCTLSRASYPPDPKLTQVVRNDRFRRHPLWARPTFEAQYDYGAILLPDRELFKDCGVFKLKAFSDIELTSHVRKKTSGFAVSGFPVDLSPRGTTQWRDLGPLKSSPSDRGFIRHLINTYKGQSGSPLAFIGTNKITMKKVPVAFGVHSRGSKTGLHNVAARVNQSFLNWVQLRIEEVKNLNRSER